MDLEKTEAGTFFEILAWAEQNKQKLIIAAAVAVVACAAILFYSWRKQDMEDRANAALSKLQPTQTAAGGIVPVPASAYLNVVNTYPKTAAAARARLLAAGALFAEGKPAEAKSQFDAFLRNHPASPFRGEALYGIGACLEAQGRISEAIAAYREIVERRPNDAVATRAKLALARLYQAQNNADEAFRLYGEVARAEAGMTLLGIQAEMGLEDLKRSNPNLGVPEQPAASLPLPVAGTNQP